MAARISSFVNTVQLRLKIEQATSTDDDPTPIYLQDEVVQMVGSSSKNISEAVETIQHRLQHRTATVKQKALKLVKHVAQRGSPEFKRALTRHSAAVRDLTHYRCSPDPFKGDIPWKRVQEYAREALEALHAAPSIQNASSSDPAVGVRIQGFGNDSGGRGGSSGLKGFSNESPKSSSSFSGGMVGFGGGLSANGGVGAPTAPESMLDSFSSGVRGLTDMAMGALTRPEHRLINSVDSADFDSYEYGLGGAGGNRLPAQIVHEIPIPREAAAGSGTQRHASPEQKLVDRICTPSGLRVAPGSEDLKAFVAAASGMDGILLATALQKKLETGSWQEILRALCAMESLLEKGGSAASGEMAVHFQAAPATVRRARQSTQTTVRDRAERVLRLLGDDTLPVDGAPKAGLEDLLGGNEVGALEPATAQKGTAVDLLAELDTTQPSLAATSGAEDFLSSFAGSSAPAPATAPASQQAPTDDLFGAWTESAPPQTDLGAAFPQTVTALGGQSLPSAGIDLLGGLSELSLGTGMPSSGMAPAPLSTSSGPPAPEIDFSFSPSIQPMQPGYGQAAPMQPLKGFGMPPPSAPSAGGVGGFGNSSLPIAGTHGGTMGGPLAGNNVLGAINAATSGFTSTQREDAAFNFVQGTMAQLKKN